ncbi:hypothetical protein [uncultured Brachyspira sp.]|uniref:hypothetical protein n=1 Tax=uncultured Brachyspira sp. TaxID=221953 RepID=UPI0026369620|nr:hypothetical protein [uncultured Brachyspira sp.]
MYPSKNLGNFVRCALDFSPKNAAKRIEQGYNDSKEFFKSNKKYTVYLNIFS